MVLLEFVKIKKTVQLELNLEELNYTLLNGGINIPDNARIEPIMKTKQIYGQHPMFDTDERVFDGIRITYEE